MKPKKSRFFVLKADLTSLLSDQNETKTHLVALSESQENCILEGALTRLPEQIEDLKRENRELRPCVATVREIKVEQMFKRESSQ